MKAQEYLNNNIIKKERSEIKILNISNRKLEGELDLSDFVSLKELNCSDNKLTSLKISKCTKLERLNCDNNQLTNLDLDGLVNLKMLSAVDNLLQHLSFSPNQKSLTNLNVSNNDFVSQDLTLFSNLTSLRTLSVGNRNDEKIQRGIYNHFYGSLKPLQNLSNLNLLAIYNTNIDSGIEYLPAGLEIIYCSADRTKIN